MSRTVLIAAVFVAALIAVGCTNKFQPPDHPLSVKAPAKWKGGETVVAPIEARWWTYLDDSGLDSAITTAIESNYDLVAAAARVEAAQAEARIAGAALKPTIDLGLNRGRQRQNFVGLPIPGRQGDVLSTTYSNAGVNLGLSWEADLWGRLGAGQAGALANVRAREADLVGSRLSLSGQVAKAWFAAIEARRQLGLARATVESYRTSAARVRERYERGLRASLDLRLALAELGRAEALVEQRQAELDAGVRQLEILLGRYPAGEHVLADDLPAVPPGVPSGLPSELVHRRPDLIASEQLLIASDTRVAHAKAELRPKFILTGGFGTASNELRDLVDGNFLAWNFLLNLTQPIYNRGRLKAGVRRDEALVRESVARYESQLLGAYREVETALAAESLLARQEDFLDAATKQSLAARDLAETRYRRGLADIITVLSSQRTALDSESRLLTLRRLRLDNRVNLHLALGGGFDAGSIPNTPPTPNTTRQDGRQTQEKPHGQQAKNDS